MWLMPKNQEHIKKRWKAPKYYIRSQIILCLGDQFDGTISNVIRKPLYHSYSWLCIKIGRSHDPLSNDARVVVRFFKKNIFTCFGTPRAIINDSGL